MSNEILDYSVVVVEYFSGQYLKSCLSSIEGQSHQPQKVVVVVNGIDESEKREVEKQFSSVHFSDPKANLGYAKAANFGTEQTDSDVVLVLNPDTVLDVDCAKYACEFLYKNKGVGSVGPQIVDIDGEVYPSARNEPKMVDAIGHGILGLIKPNNSFSRSYKELDKDPNKTRQVDWISGAAQFLRRKAVDEVGGWDEDFFMYCEDVDLGRRLRLSGWTNYYLPVSKISHVQGASSDKTPFKLIWAHHKSLYIFSKKKYKSNILMRFATALYIAVRLPISLILRFFRIN